MKYLLLLLVPMLWTAGIAVAQPAYLAGNKQDMRAENFNLPTSSFRLMGFGALHGSVKTEDAEYILLSRLAKNKTLDYYLPETDFSTAYYFQQYIKSGDDALLKELVQAYGTRVPQEGSIATFEKWKQLRPLFQAGNVEVVGIDQIASYTFPVKHLLALLSNATELPYIDSLKALTADEKADLSAYYPTPAQALLKNFVKYYQQNPSLFDINASDTATLHHLIKNLVFTFERSHREQCMYRNFMTLNNTYGFTQKHSFLRMGVFHIMKQKINGGTTLFSKLSATDFKPGEVVTIQGFLTDSKVLWDINHNKEGVYTGYTTKGGDAIADSRTEYYKGIKQLKDEKMSDLTLFRLNAEGSPYARPDDYELVVVKKLVGKSGWEPEKGKSTTDYLDYAILISDSEGARPIEEMNK